MAGGRKGDKIDGPRAPGWYADPWSATGTGERYFDGEKWGSSMRPLGRDTPKSLDFRTRESSWPRRRRVVIPVVFLVVIAAVGWYLPKLHSSPATRPSLGPKQFPTPTTEPARPLGVPAPVPAGSGQYKFELMQPNNHAKPVAFDPCLPIHYVVNPSGAPPDGLALIKSAVARVQQASGLRFVYDGLTNEAPVKRRGVVPTKRYPSSTWAPVLIAWSDASAFPHMKGGEIEGIGGPLEEVTNGTGVYRSGQVVLNREALSLSGQPVRARVRATILHELGHLVGLAHTADRREIMYPVSQPNVRDYGVGDLRGLAILGTQPCRQGP